MIQDHELKHLLNQVGCLNDLATQIAFNLRLKIQLYKTCIAVFADLQLLLLLAARKFQKNKNFKYDCN